VSYFVGTVMMLIAGLATGAPQLGRISQAPVLTWLGGVFGAIFIGIATLMVPRLGAATVLALIVVGQMLGSLAFDHFGLMGLPQQPVTLARLLGVGLLIAGVMLVRR